MPGGRDGQRAVEDMEFLPVYVVVVAQEAVAAGPRSSQGGMLAG
ncbi:MAG: hypothetical protein OXN84_08315 [Albidovulum sp.]|nr:hypothetical protein [Albidovulum sp.]